MTFSAGTFLTGRRLGALGGGLLLGVFLSSGAWAQVGPMSRQPVSGPRSAAGPSGPAAEKPEPPPPDAVPGAKARAPVAPPTHAVTDMAPNDALFDAINRGDIAAARDSLNRGADLSAVNILGLTPMELSVDLGRNDISFLLLSMRGEDSGRGARTVARDAATARPGPIGKSAAAAKPLAATRSVAQAKQPQEVKKPAATPKLLANDGGTPQPKAGFLGFDSRSATN